MTDKTADLLTFRAADARRFVAAILVAAGWTRQEAETCAEHLVLADVSGHPSHGIGMLPIYIDTFKTGELKPSNQPKVLREDGPFLLIQANRALGQVAALDATRRGIAIAKRQGVAIVNMLDAFHIGRIGHYGEEVAREGLVGLFWVNVHGRPPIVAPYGGREPRFTTNPHCVAIPRPGEEPFLLDFATSEIAMGKARVAYAQGKTVKDGAVIDHEGVPTREPRVMFEPPLGALTTFGAHKGFGMAVAVELLSTVLGCGDTTAEPDQVPAIHNNMLAIIIDPARLGGSPEETKVRTERMIQWVKSSAPAKGSDGVLIAGEPEFRSRRAFGDTMVIEPFTWNAILAAARHVGLPEKDDPERV